MCGLRYIIPNTNTKFEHTNTRFEHTNTTFEHTNTKFRVAACEGGDGGSVFAG